MAFQVKYGTKVLGTFVSEEPARFFADAFERSYWLRVEAVSA